MIYFMPVALVAIVLFALHEYLGFGPGGMERLAAYPEVIWLISFGIYISHSHYSNNSAHRTLTANRFGQRFGASTAQKPLRLRLPATRRLPDGTANSNYTFKLTPLGGTGNRLVFTANGPTPPGLTLDAKGVVDGSPTKPGRYRLPVEVTDSKGEPVRKTYTLRVKP